MGHQPTTAIPGPTLSGEKRARSWPKGEAKQQEEAPDKRAVQQRQEAVAALRRRHRIHVSPGTPDPVESFDNMANRRVGNLKGDQLVLYTLLY